MSLQRDIERREKLQALTLAKECYTTKLDLLTNATVVKDAMRFVASHQQQNQLENQNQPNQPKQRRQPNQQQPEHEQEQDNNIDNNNVIEATEEATSKATTSDQIF